MTIAKSSPGTRTTIYVSNDLLEQLDTFVDNVLLSGSPLAAVVNISRADIIRMLLARAIEEATKNPAWLLDGTRRVRVSSK